MRRHFGLPPIPALVRHGERGLECDRCESVQRPVAWPNSNSARCWTKSGAAARCDFRFQTFSNRLQRPPNGNRRPATSKRSMLQYIWQALQVKRPTSCISGVAEGAQVHVGARRTGGPLNCQERDAECSHQFGAGRYDDRVADAVGKGVAHRTIQATPPCRNTFLPTLRRPFTRDR